MSSHVNFPSVDTSGISLEVELSTRCTAKCPRCPREILKNQRSDWNVGFIDAEVLLRFLKKTRYRQLIFCGVFGDPIYHPQLLYIISEISKYDESVKIVIETNGSGRSEDWWENLAKKMRPQDILSFSIDGLADTNAIYRIGTNWQSIVSGLKIARKFHKGRIQWKWIVFKHNENQIREGYLLSREMGVDNFILVETKRHTDESVPTKDLIAAQKELVGL